MALFVVACGVLLMLGGAIALLLGFDIVLTERGSAMTIGGVVALSGGVIAVGIGFALMRLNQILGALEARAGRPVRTGGPDRPVIPIATDEHRLPLPTVGTEAADAAPPLRPSPTGAPVVPPTPAGASGSFSPGSAVAGVAAGAAAIGAAAVFGRSEPASMDEGRPSIPEPPAPAASLERDPIVSEAVADSIPDPILPAAPLALPRDLEEELSRALAETSLPQDAGIGAEDSSSASRSFEDGLSELLGRRSHRSAADPGRQPEPDLADLLPPMNAAADPIPAETGEAQESSGAETAAEEGQLREAVEPRVELAEKDILDILGQPEAPKLDIPREVDSVLAEQPLVADAPADDEDLFREPTPVASGDPHAMDLDGEADEAGGHDAPEPSQPVLGTYAIGGRTYRMFADGSVEAVSEVGEIERFSSMEALRKHLARV